MTKLRYRTVWLSDIHLGTRDAQVDYLLDFLNHVEFDTLYLVGDIIDVWKMRSGWYWTQTTLEVVHKVMERARQGVQVIYIPGNHDEILRDYCGTFVNGLRIERQAIHRCANGKRLLVMHGDEFDCVVVCNKWLAHLGSWAYDSLLALNRRFDFLRRKLGFGYWSLAGFLKVKVKSAVNFIGNFEDALVRAAHEAEVDGVVCGHVHHADLNEEGAVFYANCGDWVESCTALTEDDSGSFRIIHWARDGSQLLKSVVGDNPPIPIRPRAAA